MADTTFATGDNLTQKIWAAQVMVEAKKTEFFHKFTGKDDNAIIMEKSELTKKKGDRITIPLRMQLTSEGVPGSGNLEGNEEEMIFHDYSITVDEEKSGVRAKSKMDLQRPAFDLRAQFKTGLVDWWSQREDELTLRRLSASPTTNRRCFGGSTATSDATLAIADTFSTSVISKAKRKAELATPKVRPAMVNGKKYYPMLVHQYQLKALKAESAWQQAVREADVRGRENPMFSGADFYWDGVFLFEYERIHTHLAGESFEAGDACAVNTARALLLGAQAGICAYAQYPAWYEKLFDYNRIPGVATDALVGYGKTVFNGEDFGTITVDTAYVAD